MSIKLYYEENGTGEPLILLHGNGESHKYFAHQMEYFSKFYRVIAIDTRGHGRSPRGEAPFTIRQFARDLHDFMKEQKIGPAYTLGFSDGGNIALMFALRYPQFVKKLILNGANLYPRGVKASVQVPITVEYYLACLFAKTNKRVSKKAELLGLMVNDPYIAPEELNNLFIKTLVITGTKDMIKKRHSRLIYEKLPQSEQVILEGDHFIAAKQWEKFNFEIKRFLES